MSNGTPSNGTEYLDSRLKQLGITPGEIDRVDLPETGTMIFTADAVYVGASYGPPAVPAAKSDATLVFGHDPEQIQQLRVAPTGSYR
jgi:hypothetical protein